MNSDTIDDLKQFISATILQNTVTIREDISRLDKKIDSLDSKLSAKIDDLSQFFAETFTSQSDSVDPKVDNHEKRIEKLEAKVFPV